MQYRTAQESKSDSLERFGRSGVPDLPPEGETDSTGRKTAQASISVWCAKVRGAFARVLLIQACEKFSGITLELGYPSPRLDGPLGVQTMPVHAVAFASRGAPAGTVETADRPAVHCRRHTRFTSSL